MTVTQLLPFGYTGLINYHKQKKVNGVAIPGDMSYDYLRREIMFGTMSVNTVVKIGFNDFYNNYKYLLYDYTSYDPYVEISDHDVSDDEYDDYDDFDDFDDFNDDNEIIGNILLSIGGNQGNQANIGSNPGSQVIIGGNSISQVNISANMLNPVNIGGNSVSQVSIGGNGGNQVGQSSIINNDIMEGIYSKELTILHIAMLKNDVEFVEYLLDNKVDIMLTTQECGPIIFLAICMKKIDYIKKILDAGFLLDHRSNVPELTLYSPHTALEVAVSLNAYEIIEYLISQGAQVNVDGPNVLNSPLKVAAKHGDVKMMKFLIGHGAVVNVNTLEAIRSSGNNLKAVKFLLSNPAVKLCSEENTSKTQSTIHKKSILFWPMIYGSKKMLACLLDAGADVNVVGKDGKMIYEGPGLQKSCVGMIKEHIVKLIAADLYVCDKNREAVSNDEYSNFFIKCQEEVEIIKAVPVKGTDLTCYDLLHKSEDELTLCMKDFDDCVILEKEFLMIFPLYGGMIISRITRSTIHCV